MGENLPNLVTLAPTEHLIDAQKSLSSKLSRRVDSKE
jgi:hypothetical protein